MHQFSSDSDYNMSDSEGFNNFMNESDSSSGYVPMPKSQGRQAGRPAAAVDQYAYDIDFANIKAPSKADIKSKKTQQASKPEPKKLKNIYEDSSSSSSRPTRKPAKVDNSKKEFNKMVKKLKGDSSDESSVEESLESSEYVKQIKKKNYLDSSSDLSESNDVYNIKTEPFINKINQPISLNKKIDPKDFGKDNAKPGKNEKGFFKDKKKIGKMSPLSSDLFNSSEIGSEFKKNSENSEDQSDLYSETPSEQLNQKKGVYAKNSSNSSQGYTSNSNSLYQSKIEQKGQIEKFSENFSVKPLENLRKNVEKSEEKSHESDYYVSQEEDDDIEEEENYTEYQSNTEVMNSNRNYDKESGNYIESERKTENQSEYYSENFEAYESQQLVDSHPVQARNGKVGESIFKINEAENEDESRNVKTPAAVPKGVIPRPQTTNDYLKTRERELEIELIDLRRLVANLNSELEAKQEQLFYYEKREKQANFAKVEFEALEKAKTQLREAFHKIELYKIETEELIKQVDFNEARVRDLEAENSLLKTDMDRKEKLAEERMKLTESRTSERLIKEMTRQFELEKEDFLRRKNEMEIDFSRTKSELAKLEGENRELRTRLFSLRENEDKIKDLEQQNFLLSQKLPEKESIEQPKEKDTTSDGLRKEIAMQDQLISGFQRENEKLTMEIRKLKAQLKEEQLRSHHENRKVDLLKSNLIRDHGGVLIKENVSDLASINELAGGTVINKEDYLALKDNVARLSRELMEKERKYREKELEYCEQIENLKKFRFESEYLITSMQRSQGLPIEKGNDERFEIEKKEIIENYEKEIGMLQERIVLLSQTKTEDSRVKFLEEHIRSLEEALKHKEPISTLIKAVKPESSDQVNFLLNKISDLEEKLKKSSASNKKPGKSVTKTHPKVAEGGLQEKIKLLEKQLEETKSYYISKLSSIKPDNTEELKHLREQVLNYERVIDGMQRQKKGTQNIDLLPFFSSFSGSVWCQICQEVSVLQSHIAQKNTKELIQISSKLIEILESTSASPNFTNLSAFDKILDKTLAMFSLLKGIPNWVSIEKLYSELTGIISKELNVAWQGEQVEGSEFEEEYWSDFSDNDTEEEEQENLESLEILNKIKDGLGYLTRIGGGWLTLSQVQEILSSNLPDLNTISLRNMLRKISPPGGQINIDQFLKEVREKPQKWWEEKLRTFLWEQKEKISIKGNFCSVVEKNFVPWIIEGILEKVENYIEKEGIDCDMLTEQLFTGNLAISKRVFRKKVLEHKLPLTREECHVLVKELDKGKVGQINAKVFLAFFKRSPKQAWVPKPAEGLSEFKQLSERDANFLLVQANKRIAELESAAKQHSGPKVNLTTDYTLGLKLKTAEEELESVKSKFSFILSENEKLKIDKTRLENHISKQPMTIGASEYLALQRKVEIIEENHYRREQELRNVMSGMTFKSEQETLELKKRFEAEKIQLQKILTRKNQEINEFKSELEELLKEIELLRARKRGK